MIFNIKQIEDGTNKLTLFGNTFKEIGDYASEKGDVLTNWIFDWEGNMSGSLWNNLFPKDNVNIDELSQQFTTLRDLVSGDNGVSLGEAIDFMQESMGGLDDSVINFAKNNDIANTSTKQFTESLKQQTLSAKAGKVAMQGLAMAGNMLAGIAIGVAISLVVKGIDKLIHAAERAEEALENAQQATKDFANTIKSLQDETKSMSNTIDEIGESYAKLSQGVDTFTNKNISLSTEEYEEFLSLNNQLAELFPGLTKRYDENGNAILELSGDVDSVTNSIARLVERQKDLAKMEMRQTLESYVNGDGENGGQLQVLKGLNDNLDKAEEDLIDLERKYNSLISGELVKEDLLDNSMVEDAKDFYRNAFGLTEEELQKSLVLDRNVLGDGVYRFDFSNLEIDEVRKNQILQSYETFYKDLNNNVYYATTELEAGNKELSSMMMIWLEDLPIYKDNGEYFQTALSKMLQSVQWSELGIEDYDGVKQYVQSNILSPLQSVCDNPEKKAEVVNILSKLFSEEFSKDLLTMTPAEAQKQIDSLFRTLEDVLGKDYLELKVQLGFDSYDDLASNYNTVISKAINKFSGVSSTAAQYDSKAREIYNQEKSALDKFASENSINTQDEIAIWNECIEKAEDYDELVELYIERIKEVRASSSEGITDIFATEDANGELNTLGKLNEQLDKIQSAYKTLSDTIDTYNNTGYITIDQFQEIIEQGDDFLDYLTLEDGQLGMNEQAMYDLAEARIVEMKAKMINNIIDNVTNIKDETDALKYLESTNYELADSYQHLAQSKIKAWATDMLKSGNLTSGQIDEVTEKAFADIDKINALVAKIDLTSLAGGSGSGSGSEYDWKNLLDKEIALLEKQLDAGLIDFDTYLGKRLDLIEKYYQEGKIKAEDYYSYLEATYENQLSIYDRVISAVTNKLEKQIEQLEKQKAVIEEGFQLQIDKLNEEIELLEKEYQKKKDLEELEQARFNAEKARNQRTKRVK